jgi:hypothetical protein
MLAVAVKLVAVLLKIEMLWGEGGLTPSLRALKERAVGATVKEVGVSGIALKLAVTECGAFITKVSGLVDPVRSPLQLAN